MSKMFTRTYVSKICPELLLSEVDIVYEEVLVNSHPDDVYPKQVRDTAERMFPGIVMPLPKVNADNVLDLCGMQNLQDATGYLEQARHCMESISLPDDEVARVVFFNPLSPAALLKKSGSTPPAKVGPLSLENKINVFSSWPFSLTLSHIFPTSLSK